MTQLHPLSDSTAETLAGGLSINFSSLGSGFKAFSGFASNGVTKTNISGGNNTNFNTGFIQIAEFNYYS
jgi:hypothetical protein